MAYDVDKLCRKAEVGEFKNDKASAGRYTVIVDPAVIYPETIKRIKEVIDKKIGPDKVVELHGSSNPLCAPGAAAAKWLGDVKKVDKKIWDLALMPRDKVHGREDIAKRAVALELARGWFTRALKAKHCPLAIQITKNEKYRL